MSEASEAAAPRRPTAGERARTLSYGVADGVLAVPGVPYAAVPAHATDADGRPLLLLPAESAVVSALAGEPDLPATLRISDVAPVPLPDRLRGQAWLHGWITEVPEGERRDAALRISRLHPRPELLEAGAADSARRRWTVLALEVAEVEVKDMWGSATLEPEEYAAGVPDPLVAIESGILSHLDECHRDELVVMLRRLDGASHVPAARAGRDTVVRPLALDRYGMWLRCSGTERTDAAPVDLRVVFGEPVSDIHGLRCVYRRLFAGVSH
ncbi:DUF2470 domain-containing protein [Spirillospora sp. NPDC029432]|uniref:DUF2470 domain-containing protein n=1 Tax=Spirillospora sp. NPDC029432 TaxID=3154599 RepID=UPI003453AF92